MLWGRRRTGKNRVQNKKNRKKKRIHMNLEQQLEGMVTLGVQTQRPTEVLALLSGNGVVLYHVSADDGMLYATIDLENFKRTQRLLRDNHMRFRICGKRGIPFVINKCKRRKGIWMGLVCAVLLGHFLLSFLWTYEVMGNEYYSDAHIIALVQQYGLWPGTRMEDIEYDAIEYTIELEHPEFTWVQLEQKGTTLCIEVKERLANIVDLKNTGSIIAKADGRITELTVYTGTAMVNMGDTVQSGQVLIGGWDYPERVRNELGVFVDAGTPYTVYAQGMVRGEVTHRAVGTCGMDERWLVNTGAAVQNTALLWGKHRLISFGKETSPYRYSETMTERRSLFSWGRWQCPIILCTTTYQEQTIMQRSFTPEEAYQTAVERARRQLQQSIPQDGVFIRESSGLHRNTQDGVIQAEVVWIVEEPLGRMAQIPLP